jgi:hypothetical protein
MADLVILNLPQDVLSHMRRLANKGDEEAQRWLKVDLWKEYTPAFACLLCDGDVHQVNATLSLPDNKPRKGEEQQMRIAPLCDTCDGLPTPGPLEPHHQADEGDQTGLAPDRCGVGKMIATER